MYSGIHDRIIYNSTKLEAAWNNQINIESVNKLLYFQVREYYKDIKNHALRNI